MEAKKIHKMVLGNLSFFVRASKYKSLVHNDKQIIIDHFDLPKCSNHFINNHLVGVFCHISIKWILKTLVHMEQNMLQLLIPDNKEIQFYID